MKGNPMTQRAAVDARNHAAAAVILKDPARYSGESAGLVQWARLFMAKHAAMMAGDAR